MTALAELCCFRAYTSSDKPNRLLLLCRPRDACMFWNVDEAAKMAHHMHDPGDLLSQSPDPRCNSLARLARRQLLVWRRI